MKRLLTATLMIVLLFGTLPTVSLAVGSSASSAILMDGSSGRVLYEQNAHEKRLIASITKLMTGLVALDYGHDLEEPVEILPEYTLAEGSSIYLVAGESLSLKALLYGMMLQSGNDAALAVASFCGGSVENFVVAMNEKAAELGMTNSSFANPNGLNADDHYSTAYDMALLAKACLEHPVLAEIVATRSIALEGRSFANHNKMLWRYSGCIGLKTGYTEKAGRTLVSAAQRDGLTVIAVTLNDPNDWLDHTNLLDYGFANYQNCVLAQEGEIITHLPVENSLIPFVPVLAQDSCQLAVGEGEGVEKEIVLDETSIQAPIAGGTQVGRLICTLNGEPLAEIPLLCGMDVASNVAPRQGLWERLTEQLPNRA